MLLTTEAPLRLDAPAGKALRLRGTALNGLLSGRYRGALEVRPAATGGVNAINAIGLENYVRGVISGESPASWPSAALQAQAVAARSYAITTSRSKKDGFDQYPDQRSQVYRGVKAEFPTTDAAVAATAGQGRRVPQPAGDDVLLLDFRRIHRGGRERVHELAEPRLADRRPGSVRQPLPASQLDGHAHARRP